MTMPNTPLITIALITFVVGVTAHAQDHKMITLSGHTDKVYATAFLPDGKVVTASFDRTVKIWDVETAKVERTLAGHTDMILALSTSPDGKQIASAGKDRVIKLWNLDSPDTPQDLSGHSRSVYHVTFSPDGKLLASCGEDDTRIMIWDVEDAKTIKQLNAENPYLLER